MVKLKSGQSVEFDVPAKNDNGSTHVVISIERLPLINTAALAWHWAAYWTRPSARTAVAQLNRNSDKRQLQFSFEKEKAWSPYGTSCGKIIISGIEQIVNGYYLGGVSRDILDAAYKQAGQHYHYCIYVPNGGEAIPVEMHSTELAQKVAEQFITLYKKAHDALISADAAPADVKENVVKTMQITGHVKWFERGIMLQHIVNDRALGLSYERMTPEEQKHLAGIIATVFVPAENVTLPIARISF